MLSKDYDDHKNTAGCNMEQPTLSNNARPWQHIVYWCIMGAVLGFGLIGMMTIGLPFLLIGVLMVVYGASRVGKTGVWGLLVGFGALPALFLLPPYFFLEPCAPGTVLSIPADAPPGTVVSCSGPVPQAYLYLGLVFAAVAVIGLVWGVTEMKRMDRSARA